MKLKEKHINVTFTNSMPYVFNIWGLIKSKLAFLILMFQLGMFTSFSQTTNNNLELDLEFNYNGIIIYDDVLEDQILNKAVGNNEFTQNNGYISFWDVDSQENQPNTSNGGLALKNEYFTSLNDSIGYTIVVKVKAGYGLSSEPINKQVFYIKDINDNLMYGFKILGKKLVLQRYVRDNSGNISGFWDFELWNAQYLLDDENDMNVDRVIMISVTEDLIRIKIYGPNMSNNDSCKSCELLYLGGQELNSSEMGAVGFGSPDGISGSVYGIDFFKIYSGTVNSFEEMDTLYNSTQNETNAGKIINKKLDIVDNLLNDKVGVKMFPNPISAENEIYAKLNLKQADKVTFQILGLSGQLIRSESFNASSGITKHAINLRGISSGIYIIKTQGAQINETHKIIIE